jgi:hypothetical protein
MRSYLKYTPVFLLPAVFNYTDQDMSNQLKVLLLLALIQTPIAFAQKFGMQYHADVVAGTLGIGSTLSIYVVCAITILFSFYYRGYMSLRLFLLLSFIIFLPTTINESKITLVLLPVALLVVAALSPSRGLSGRHLIAIVGVLACFALVYTFVYNKLYDIGGEGGLVSFFTEPERGVKHYLYSGKGAELDPEKVLKRKETGVVGEIPGDDARVDKIRRLDSIVLPLRVLSDDPVKLVLGLGIGNVGESFIERFSGDYTHLYNESSGKLSTGRTQLNIWLWEIGIVGIALFLLFFFWIFLDASHLRVDNGFVGTFAVGWAVVVIIIVLTLPYRQIMVFNVLGFLFWYFSGYIAAKSVWMNVDSRYP